MKAKEEVLYHTDRNNNELLTHPNYLMFYDQEDFPFDPKCSYVGIYNHQTGKVLLAEALTPHTFVYLNSNDEVLGLHILNSDKETFAELIVDPIEIISTIRGRTPRMSIYGINSNNEVQSLRDRDHVRELKTDWKSAHNLALIQYSIPEEDYKDYYGFFYSLEGCTFLSRFLNGERGVDGELLPRTKHQRKIVPIEHQVKIEQEIEKLKAREILSRDNKSLDRIFLPKYETNGIEEDMQTTELEVEERNFKACSIL